MRRGGPGGGHRGRKGDDVDVADSEAGRTGKTSRAGRPPVTSRAEILVAARRLIDTDGWERLTIRRLASELGIGATTLYHHVRDKWELQVLMLNEYAAQIPRPTPSDDPVERIMAAATAVREAFAAWPWGADASAVDGFITLLDESAVWPVEEMIAAARDAGCDEAGAVALFRNVWYFIIGEVLVRARSAQGSVDRGRRQHEFLGQLDPERMPYLAAIGGRWPELAARDTFPAGLRALVVGMLP